MDIESQKKGSTIDIIYNKIKNKIIELVYSPEEQLLEVSLSKQLQVSRTPLRQALYRLELEGLLVKHANGRVSVAPMSIQESEEIFRVREVIEGLIARESTINIATSTEFNSIIYRFEDIIYLMRRVAETGRQEEIVTYGSQFHNLLISFSDNETAKVMLEQINNRISRYRRIGVYKDPKYPSLLPVKEHERILDFIKLQDEITVEKIMRQHIRRSLSSTVDAINSLTL